MASARAVLQRPASGLLVGAALALAAAAVAAARLSGAAASPQLQIFVVLFTAIAVEALPFVLLGALVSAAIAVYVPDRAFERIAALPLPAQLPAAALGGMAFPVCECGSVPVARRLITRGLHPAAGVAFMLAAPIVNPVVLLSTVVAYRTRGLGWEMAAGRAAVGLVLALVGGWAAAHGPARDLLRVRADGGAEAARGGRLVEHLVGDFWFMGRFVVLGAALAAALQTAVPHGLVSGIAATPVVGSLALMALAFVMSLCSEADAFVAVSFVQFPLAAQLAFLVFGPVVDAKLLLLYGATFRRRFVTRLAVVAVPVALAGSMWFEVLVG